MSDHTISEIVHAYRPGRLCAEGRRAFIARRRWTRGERRAALDRLVGRLGVALEPLLCAAMFGALVFAVLSFRAAPSSAPNLVMLVPISAVGLLLCLFSVATTLAAPLRAALETLRPLFVVDGYLRSRPPDERSPLGSNGYVAVLGAGGEPICEWVTIGRLPLAAGAVPALVEFSERGGVHRVDGRPGGRRAQASSMKILRATR